MHKLTSKEEEIQKEIQEVRNLIYFYNEGVCEFILECEKGEMIRNKVITDCAQLEEKMTIVIMNYILSDSKAWAKVKYYGRIKRFLILSDEILARIWHCCEMP